MTTPWPAEVLDCAKRLAKSLGYEDDHVMTIDGVVEVYRRADSIPFSEGYDNWYWFELDPRDPTVWSALIISGDIYLIIFNTFPSTQGNPPKIYPGHFLAYNRKETSVASLELGIAVCEAYNALKGNALGKANHSVKLYE